MDFRESSFLLIKRSTKVQKLHTVAGMHHDHKLELSKSTSSMLERSVRSLLLSSFLEFFSCAGNIHSPVAEIAILGDSLRIKETCHG
jgi:hypothetical protein